MTQPHNAYPSNQPAAAATLQRPSGWPVASFDSYAQAQAAVDHLSDRQFPVQALTIVGVDLMQVEKVTGRLTWGRVLGGGALSGLWLGLFVGLLFAIFTVNPWSALFSAILIGVVFGLIFAAVGYAMTQGKRDFSSATTIVAGRYDVLCEPSQAPQARDMLNQQAQQPTQPAPEQRPDDLETPNNPNNPVNPERPQQ